MTVFGLAFLGFLSHLPRDTRRRFVLAGSLYVSGALVMELPLGYWTDIAGSHNLTYALIDWVEESLEIAGLSIFAYSLVRYSGLGAQDQMEAPIEQIGVSFQQPDLSPSARYQIAVDRRQCLDTQINST